MENFDIAKYLKEHQLGSYGILNHYVDLKPLKEEETEEELATEIPYEGPEHKLTGNGEGDEFEQAETVSEEYNDDMDYDRIMDIGGNSIEQGIIRLMDDGFPAEDVLELCKSFIEDQYGAKASGMQFEETFSEGGTNRLDFPAIETAIQSIVDDLVDDGFPVEEVEQHLKDLISNAAAPYKQKKIVNR